MENIKLDHDARRLRSPIQYREWLTKAQIRKYQIIPDPPGAWIEIRKKENVDFSDSSHIL